MSLLEFFLYLLPSILAIGIWYVLITYLIHSALTAFFQDYKDCTDEYPDLFD